MSKLISGPIEPEKVSDVISKHSHKTDIGAFVTFCGQVREDIVGYKKVEAIQFSAYKEMAIREIDNIRERILQDYPVKCMHIYHSIGEVKVGSICFFILIAAPHRKQIYTALDETVELFKANVPIWKELILEDGTNVWKEDEEKYLLNETTERKNNSYLKDKIK